MSTNSVKRILSDINSLTENPLENEGIYWSVNEDNIYNMKALIIGPKDTPYEGGFFFFNFNFPENYPLEPPKAEYHTLYGNVRFNPNLYTNKYVCLSILNTWHGPSWTPCNTITSVLMSLLGLVFVQHPLVNEPGHETDPPDYLDAYDAIIEHETYRGGCLYMLEHIPKGFEEFKPKIEKYFVDNFEKYITRAKNLQTKREGRHYSACYGMHLTCNYSDIIDKMNKLYFKLNKKMPDISDITVAELRKLAKEYSVDLRTVNNDGKKIYKRKEELYKSVNEAMV
jgi:ubiquitin-conjugating enzyme E2 Z